MKVVTANKINRLWRNGVLAKMIAKTKVLNTAEEIEANTSAENVAGALVAKELYNNLMCLNDSGKIENFHVGEDGKPYITYKVGADSVSKKLGNGNGNFEFPEKLTIEVAVGSNPWGSLQSYDYGNVTLPTFGYHYYKSSSDNKEIDISNLNTITLSVSSSSQGREKTTIFTFYNQSEG